MRGAGTGHYSSLYIHKTLNKKSLLILEVLKFSNDEVVKIVEQKKHLMMSKLSYINLVKNNTKIECLWGFLLFLGTFHGP